MGTISSVEKRKVVRRAHGKAKSWVALPSTSASWMPQTKTARFPRSGRLLRHADFERVYQQGRRHFSASMTVFYWLREAPEPGAHFRVGFTVGRALGGAVQRNRMKRRLREAVRLSHPAVNLPVDVVINPKKSMLAADFDAVLNEINRAWVVIAEKLAAGPGRIQSAKPGSARTSGDRKPEA